MAVMNNIRKNRLGFTLIEIVVVMGITAVLALLIIGAIMIVRGMSTDAKYTADAKTVRDILESYYANHRRYPCAVVDGNDVCTTNYNRINAYSLFTDDVDANQGTGEAKGELGEDGDKLIGPSSYPEGDPDRVCFTTCGSGTACPDGKGSNYYLWVVSENQSKRGIKCNVGGPGFVPASPGIPAVNPELAPGFYNSDIKIHGPKDAGGPGF